MAERTGSAGRLRADAGTVRTSAALNGITLPGVVPFRSVLMARWNLSALDLIETERVTFMVGPPTFFRALMDAPSFTARAAPLRLVSGGGAGVSDAFVMEASERLGAQVKRTYTGRPRLRP